ncbi:cytochrome P450 [Hypoxylon sp. EC38]|nr:cytochrome P450 [Hypoxylon sp. EC38]
MLPIIECLSDISPLRDRSCSIVVGFLTTWLCYIFALAFYRLYLSPLAKFPGPKLAALTQWYEIYFDVFKQGGGRFTFEIKRMHEKYGPIVRINPIELHVDDPAYYVIYANNKQYDKMPFFSYRFNMPLAVFATAKSEKHRERRAAIAPFFNRSRIRDYGGYVHTIVDRVSNRLSTEYAGTEKVLNLLDMWGSMASDVVMEFCFARPKHHVDAPEFKSEFTTAHQGMVFSSHIMTHFGFILTFMNALPNWLVKATVAPIKSVIEYQEEIERQISDILKGRNIEAENSSHPTIFHEILSSNLPLEDLTLPRLQNEAMSTISAGIETTKWAISVTSYHILANPDVERHLRAELKDAIPGPNGIPHWTELEKLPYLNARSPRINRSSSWTYRDYVIPPGVPVSMDLYHMHTNPVLFPQPDAFIPDRWLGDPRVEPAQLEAAGYLPPIDGKPKPLSHFMVGFGRGTRMCVGMHLAYAEIYIGLAMLFRRHELTLFETSRRDAELAMDMVTAQPWRGSKGIRVLVRK